MCSRHPRKPEGHTSKQECKLRSYCDLRGCQYKIPGEALIESTSNLKGVGLESCIVPLRKYNLSLIQTSEILYPLVDDPVSMGRIACANVVSGLYACGVIKMDSLSLTLAICTQMPYVERCRIMDLIVQGFQENADRAEVTLVGQHSIYNTWCYVGGTASAVCRPEEFIMPTKAQVGDVLVLTKPLGPHMACNAYKRMEDETQWNKYRPLITKEEMSRLFDFSVRSMTRLNKVAAELMHEFNAHGATEVTSFGLLHHAQNLVESQQIDLKFVIHTLPVIRGMGPLASLVGNDRFLKGQSSETSGGLLICLPKDQAAAYCKEIKAREGWPAWMIGDAYPGNRTAYIVDKPIILEVEPGYF